ncbi:MAG: extracellular solute-binding protein [Puniceicoccales bacterium]|jgi:ABC-type Fe3+ transport system substrate-binding protein|nr:extracellular solute-binding protein [Puniceicoccales bacterium]
MIRKWIVFFGLLLILGLPFWARKSGTAIDANTDDTIIVLTGHNEKIRFELGCAFRQWYREKTGRTIFIDWRYLGGISEMVRYLDSIYTSEFRYHWEKELNRQWTQEVNQIFVNRTADEARWQTPLHREIYEEFYNSNVSSGIDLFFGGGITDFISQADLGALVDTGFLREHGELFNEDTIPHYFAGSELWDREGHWFGQALSSFGILLNGDVLRAHGLERGDVMQWEPLTNPKLFGIVALTDPTKSSAILKAFEMIVQQQMMFALQNSAGEKNSMEEADCVKRGWMRGLEIIQLISANTRYYADGPSKMILDVASGNSGVGLIVDFMGRTQCAEERQRSGRDRLEFILPQNGSAISPDPIGILRGAPNLEAAKLFLEYVLCDEGQKILTFEPGTEGGPIRHALFRPPVNKHIYDEKYLPLRTFSTNPFRELMEFAYRPENTSGVYNALKWTIKFAFIIPHQELVRAWKAIITARDEGRHGDADLAQKVLGDFSEFEYDHINQTLAPILRNTDPVKALELQRKIVSRFQRQYNLARKIAENS